MGGGEVGVGNSVELDCGEGDNFKGCLVQLDGLGTAQLQGEPCSHGKLCE